MAGIGFRLQKILRDGTYSGSLKAYLYAAAVSSGPWLFTVISVGILGFFSYTRFQSETSFLFRTVLVYTFAFSLIITGTLQMVITRYLSDRFFSRDYDAVLPTYIYGSAAVTISQSITAWIFYSFTGLDLSSKVAGTILYTAVCNIWMAMIFLSALRNYRSILRAFASGSFFSAFAGLFFGIHYGITGLIGGFASGQILILVLLSKAVFSEFKLRKNLNREFFHYFTEYPRLIFIGLFYNLAIWIDKLIFWFSESTGTNLQGPFFYSKIYDAPMYLAYLSIIPALSLFIIRVETSFYNHYRDFYGAIQNRLPLRIINEKKNLMTESIFLSIQRLFKVQGAVTAAFIIFSPLIIKILKMNWDQLPVLRIGALTAFIHSLLLILSIIILYFDFRKLCLGTSALFLISNALFTMVSIKAGPRYYGYGYFFSAFITLIISFLLFALKMRKLEYITFMKQPVISRKRPL
ncbi:MAG: exopolysaccharide Pel transporter PelG [Fibrobacterota bacterium]